MFMGEFIHTLDVKGRIILPAKFRDGLGDLFVATKGLDNCLFIYSQSEWAVLEEKLRRLSIAKPEARAFARFFFSGAAELECDKQGRVLLPSNLREHAGLNPGDDAVVIGVSNRIEIWNRLAWETYMAKISPSVEKIAENIIDVGI